MAIETNLNKRIVTGEDIDVTVALTTTAKKVHPAINELKASIDSKEAKFGDGTKVSTQTGVGYSKGEADPFRSVKDLTHLTTQDEIYNAVEFGKYYLIKTGDHTGQFYVQSKTASWATFSGQAGINTSLKQYNYYLVCYKGNNILPSKFNTQLIIGNPTADDEAANKKYVDDADAKKANIALDNVNVGTANAGKSLQVKADGTIEYVDANAGGSIPKPINKKTGKFSDYKSEISDALFRGDAVIGTWSDGTVTTTGNITIKGTIFPAAVNSMYIDGVEMSGEDVFVLSIGQLYTGSSDEPEIDND